MAERTIVARREEKWWGNELHVSEIFFSDGSRIRIMPGTDSHTAYISGPPKEDGLSGIEYTTESITLMTKAEYVQHYPHSAQFCWCGCPDWDVCPCGFYESTPKCTKCGHGLDCCCVCLAVGGPLSKMLDAVKDGTMTEAEALARLERGSEPAAYRKNRHTTVATTKGTKGLVFYLINTEP